MGLGSIFELWLLGDARKSVASAEAACATMPPGPDRETFAAIIAATKRSLGVS